MKINKLLAASAILTSPLAWATPTLSTSTANLGNFTAAIGAPSGSKSFTINGSNLVGTVDVKAPPGFEVSTNNSTFAPSVTLGTPAAKMIIFNGPAWAALKKDGSVVTWGGVAGGGNSSIYHWETNSVTSVAASISSNVTAIYSGGEAFAALKKDGSVVTWGQDLSGGNSSIFHTANGIFTQTSVASSLSSNVTAIFGGNSAFAALKKDGSVVTWGRAQYGGDSSGVATSLSSNVTAIYPINLGFAALKKDGSVVTWGQDDCGGDSSIHYAQSLGAAAGSKTSVESSISSNVTAIYNNDSAVAALKKDGSVVTWGQDVYGGDSTIIHWETSTRTSVAASLSSNVTAIYPTKYGFTALKRDGSVVNWGGGDTARSSIVNYGIYSPFNPISESSVVSALASNVTAIFTNGYASAALKKDGSVVTWGRAESGGNSSGVATSLSSNVTAIYPINLGFAALKKDGSVVTWGYGPAANKQYLLSGTVNGTEFHSVADSLTSNVTDIVASGLGAIAYKKDGSLVYWGVEAEYYRGFQPIITDGSKIYANGMVRLTPDGQLRDWCGNPSYDSTSLVSGYKLNNSIWLKSPPSGVLNSFFISSSCKAIFSNG